MPLSSLAGCRTRNSYEVSMFFGAATAAGSVLTFATHRLDDVMVVRCLGRIVLGHADRLRTVVKQARTPMVVLDLAETTAIDAAGLGVLVSLNNWAKATGTEFRLMNLRPEVERVFEVTKLKPAFAICSVREMFDLLCRAMRSTQAVDESSEFVAAAGKVIADAGSAA